MQDLPDSLNQVSPALRSPLRQYAERIKQLGERHVLSLSVFGEAASDTFAHGEHGVRSAVVFDAISLDTLRAISREGLRFGRDHIAAPLVFTPVFLRQSCDTYPLELIEIQQRYVVIFGDDYFTQLTFQEAHVRRQCERELKAIAIGMHQGLLISVGSDKHLAAVGRHWLENVVRTLRGILWLKGSREWRPRPEAVLKAEEIISRPLPGVRTALGLADHDEWDHFRQLYADVQALEQFVNAI